MPTAYSTTSCPARRCRGSSWPTSASAPRAEWRRVTFHEPLALVGLALIPLAIAAYVAVQRRRRQFAGRYTNVELPASGAGAAGGGPPPPPPAPPAPPPPPLLPRAPGG